MWTDVIYFIRGEEINKESDWRQAREWFIRAVTCCTETDYISIDSLIFESRLIEGTLPLTHNSIIRFVEKNRALYWFSFHCFSIYLCSVNDESCRWKNFINKKKKTFELGKIRHRKITKQYRNIKKRIWWGNEQRVKNLMNFESTFPKLCLNERLRHHTLDIWTQRRWALKWKRRRSDNKG